MSNRITQLCALVCGAILLLSVQAAEEFDMTSILKPCNHESPDYSSCLTKSAQDAWPSIVAEGIPQLDLPKLDPLEIDSLEYDYQVGSLKSHSIFRDVKLEGLAGLTYLAIRPNRTADRMSLEFEFAIPKLFAEGHYKADSIMGPFKMNGKGYFNLTLEGIIFTCIVHGRIENDRWVLDHIRTSSKLIKVDRLKVYFDDLFNGNKQLNQAALSFINGSWRELLYTTPPFVYDLVDAYWTELMNKMFYSKVSFSKMFP